MHSATEALTWASRSQSANTRLGDLPPSSKVTRLTVSAASRVTAVPARVEPVKDIICTSLWRDRAAPTVGPSPWTKLNTPGGKPAASIISAYIIAEIGVCSEGFKTQQQPVAKAGMTFNAIWFIGQFQGVINPHTPIGSRKRMSPLLKVSRSTNSANASMKPCK